jgi:hypothetical protein
MTHPFLMRAGAMASVGAAPSRAISTRTSWGDTTGLHRRPSNNSRLMIRIGPQMRDARSPKLPFQSVDSAGVFRTDRNGSSPSYREAHFFVRKADWRQASQQKRMRRLPRFGRSGLSQLAQVMPFPARPCGLSGGGILLMVQTNSISHGRE